MIQPHQQRVIDERSELDERLKKLRAFIFGTIFNTLDELEQLRLLRQNAFMKLYLDVLHERIAAFKQ